MGVHQPMTRCLCKHELADHKDIQTPFVGYHKGCTKCMCSDFELGYDIEQDDTEIVEGSL